MNFFFLIISFPRIRREANCVFRSIATRKHNETLCLWLGKCRALRGDRGKCAYTGQNINTHILCQILHSTPYFLFLYSQSLFTAVQEWQVGIYYRFIRNYSSVSAPTCPFRRLRRHLSQGKASHSLLQRRSAPRKVVRLLPVIRGRLKTCMLSFSFHKSGNAFGMIHFVIFWFCSYKNYDFFLP